MDKMQPMQSPLGNDDESSIQKGVTDIQRSPIDPTQAQPNGLNQDTGDDRGLRKLTSRLEDRRLKDHLDIDRLDTHLGDEEVSENKADDLSIAKKKDRRNPKEESILDDLKIFVPPVIRDYTTLMRFLQTHIVELRFTRRHDKAGYASKRKMVCTANWKYLSSMFTRRIFKWNTPNSRRGVSWYKRRNLIIVWDLMVQNFRIIPVGDIRFVSAYKCTSLMEKGRFLLFYRRNVGSLSEAQERKYFNS